jgi:hypothetical protein
MEYYSNARLNERLLLVLPRRQALLQIYKPFFAPCRYFARIRQAIFLTGLPMQLEYTTMQEGSARDPSHPLTHP